MPTPGKPAPRKGLRKGPCAPGARAWPRAGHYSHSSRKSTTTRNSVCSLPDAVPRARRPSAHCVRTPRRQVGLSSRADEATSESARSKKREACGTADGRQELVPVSCERGCLARRRASREGVSCEKGIAQGMPREKARVPREKAPRACAPR